MLDLTFVTGIGVAGIIAGLVMTLLWRTFLARRVWFAGAEREISKVSAYQMGLMNGGPARIALTVVVRLLGRKVLVPGPAGVLVKDHHFRDALDPLEDEAVALAPAVLKDLLAKLEQRLKRKGMIAAQRRELIGMGYMRAFGSWRWWRDFAQNMLPFALLIGLALGACAYSAMTAEIWDRVMDLLTCACVAMLVAALPTPVTAIGRYIIWSATRHHPDYKTARAREGEALDTKKLGQAVALHGREALAGSDMAWICVVLANSESASRDD